MYRPTPSSSSSVACSKLSLCGRSNSRYEWLNGLLVPWLPVYRGPCKWHINAMHTYSCALPCASLPSPLCCAVLCCAALRSAVGWGGVVVVVVAVVVAVVLK